MEEVRVKKPMVKLSGEDGNAFAIIGRVKQALKAAGQRDEASEFADKALKANGYDGLLQLVMEYVEVE